jgi:hypothetical protein
LTSICTHRPWSSELFSQENRLDFIKTVLFPGIIGLVQAKPDAGPRQPRQKSVHPPPLSTERMAKGDASKALANRKQSVSDIMEIDKTERLGKLSPRKRKATEKALAGPFSLEATRFGEGLETAGKQMEKIVVKTETEAFQKGLAELQKELGELKEAQNQDRARNEELYKELKSTIEEQQTLI